MPPAMPLSDAERQGSGLSWFQRIPDKTVQKMSFSVTTVDLLNLGFIYLFKQCLAHFLAGLGHTIMFPLAAGTGLIRAAFSFYQVKKEGYPAKGVIRVGIEVLGGLAVTAAVIGIFLAASLFATIAPLVFTFVAGSKTLYQASLASYYGYKAFFEKDPHQKQQFKKLALIAALNTVIGCFSTLAAALVLVAGKVSFGFVGFVACVASILHIGYHLMKTKSPQKPVSSSTRHLLAMQQSRENDHPENNSEINPLSTRLRGERVGERGVRDLSYLSAKTKSPLSPTSSSRMRVKRG